MEGSIKNHKTNRWPCLIWFVFFLLFLPQLVAVIPRLYSELHMNPSLLPLCANPHALGGLKGVVRDPARAPFPHLPLHALGPAQQGAD